MVAALTNVRLVAGIKQASPVAQTSCLEGFHSLLNQFCPKMIAYSYAGMFCRFVLISNICEGCQTVKEYIIHILHGNLPTCKG